MVRVSKFFMAYEPHEVTDEMLLAEYRGNEKMLEKFLEIAGREKLVDQYIKLHQQPVDSEILRQEAEEEARKTAEAFLSGWR